MQRKCVRRSVQASLKDGAFWALMMGFVEPYIVPFAMALGASTPAIGFLRSVPASAPNLQPAALPIFLRQPWTKRPMSGRS